VRVAVCDYGAGNVSSVLAAFARLGAEVCIAETPDAVTAADLAVLPGVGSAASAMAVLRERGLDEALRARVARGGPTLGICLGLQLALDWTAEDGGVEGLGLVRGRSERLRQGRVPRMGWAEVGERGAFYFAHSYAATTPAATAWSEGVVAEACTGSFLGCQFHPEKSGEAGSRYLAAVLEEARSLSLA
jgi:imidazole glycerol-phosphate synthase subunit HisH